MKIIFNPHIKGMGHRIKCNLIARELKSIDPKIKIKFLIRRDDPVLTEKWLDFEFVTGSLRRSYEIMSADCLVEDGAWFTDFRIKVRSRLGGKIIAISLPHGFSSDPDIISRQLKPVNKIIVPWPEKLFRMPDELSEFENKVRRIDPILNLLEGSKRTVGSNNIYVSISRETDKIFPIIRKAVENLKPKLPDLNLHFSESYKDFKDETEHLNILMSSDLVIAQGMTTMFESCYLGIPRISIPLPFAEEQIITSKEMVDLGAAFSIPLDELNVPRMQDVILDGLSNASVKDEMISKGRELVPNSGLGDAAQLILQTVK